MNLKELLLQFLEQVRTHLWALQNMFLWFKSQWILDDEISPAQFLPVLKSLQNDIYANKPLFTLALLSQHSVYVSTSDYVKMVKQADATHKRGLGWTD